MDGKSGEGTAFPIREAKLPDTPKTLPSKKKTFKRRSSITDLKGRRSGTFCLPPGKSFSAYADLCQEISQDLPENKRLEQLHRNCYQFALQKLEQEFDLVETLPKTLEKAREAFQVVFDDLKKNGQFQKAVELNCQLPTSEQNSEVEETIKDYEALINHLEDENKTWRQLLQQHKIASTSVPGSHIINDDQYMHLSSKDQALLSDHVDSRRVVKNLHNSREALRMQLTKMKQYFHGTLHYCEEAEEVCYSQMKKLRETHPQANKKDLILRMVGDEVNEL